MVQDLSAHYSCVSCCYSNMPAFCSASKYLHSNEETLFRELTQLKNNQEQLHSATSVFQYRLRPIRYSPQKKSFLLKSVISLKSTLVSNHRRGDWATMKKIREDSSWVTKRVKNLLYLFFTLDFFFFLAASIAEEY